nr:protein FANTASTIC FOUR 1 [Ipomoea batatas]
MPTTTAAASTVDDDDIRSADIDGDVGGNFDGLTSCTESSVGYESSVELDEIVDDNNDIKDSLSYSWRFGRTEAERRKSKKFPPPLSSLTQDGKPTFFLLPVRKDGRLKLRQVKSNWPETLLASRKDGRLRMHLIYSDDDDDQGSPEICDEQEDEAQDAITEEEAEKEGDGDEKSQSCEELEEADGVTDNRSSNTAEAGEARSHGLRRRRQSCEELEETNGHSATAERRGFDLRFANSGQRGLFLLRQWRPLNLPFPGVAKHSGAAQKVHFGGRGKTAPSLVSATQGSNDRLESPVDSVDRHGLLDGERWWRFPPVGLMYFLGLMIKDFNAIGH